MEGPGKEIGGYALLIHALAVYLKKVLICDLCLCVCVCLRGKNSICPMTIEWRLHCYENQLSNDLEIHVCVNIFYSGHM